MSLPIFGFYHTVHLSTRQTNYKWLKANDDGCYALQ